IVAWPVTCDHEPSVCHASVPLSGCLPVGRPCSSRLDSRYSSGKPPAWYWFITCTCTSPKRRANATWVAGGTSCGSNNNTWWRRKAAWMPSNTASLRPCASCTPTTSAPRCGVSGRVSKGSAAMAAAPATLLGANVAGSGGALEATHRLGQRPLGQREYDVGKHDDECDRREEHRVHRQRAHHGAAEADADVLRRHQQRQPVRRRDQPEDQRGDDHRAHVQRVD